MPFLFDETWSYSYSYNFPFLHSWPVCVCSAVFLSFLLASWRRYRRRKASRTTLLLPVASTARVAHQRRWWSGHARASQETHLLDEAQSTAVSQGLFLSFFFFLKKKNYCHVVSIIKCREIFGELILYRTSCQLTLYLLLDGVWTSLKLDSHPIYWWMGCESIQYPMKNKFTYHNSRMNEYNI